MQAVDGDRATAEPDTGLRWWDVAPALAPHYSPGLFALLFMLYRELEIAQHAYAAGIAGHGDGAEIDLALRRWELKASRILDIEDQVSNRNLCVRLWHRIRTPPFARKVIDYSDIETEILHPVARELRELGFDVDDVGNITPH
ncbi:MAG: hypothetical protein F4X80_11345 [Chloroflexi bacterium]|nr:hypothetical protein [Chloroflexota bacterium]